MSAHAADLTLQVGGKVVVELITAKADFHNTMALTSPTVAVPTRGCKLEGATNLPGEHLISEKAAQRGCRIALDADPNTPGIQPFAAGATLKFDLCAQFTDDEICEFVWHSNPASNSDRFEHLKTTELHAADYPGQIYQLAWEDEEEGGDQDFNDLIAIVRIATDSDEDGLWDDWEKHGIDTDGDGTIDLDLPGFGAKLDHKDVFLEIDYMDCGLPGSDCAAGDSHDHRPRQGALDAVVEAFKNSGVANPDRVNGISLHINVSNSMPHKNYLDLRQGNAFDNLKADPSNFGPSNPRRFAYHYAIFSHMLAVGEGNSGASELGGNDLEVSLGDFPGNGTSQVQAGVLMHELGHNLGLHHGGSEVTNKKPNYISVMSYTFLQTGIPPNDPDGSGPLDQRVDYSKRVLANLDETNLDEAAGVGAGTDNSFFRCPDLRNFGTIIGDGPANWNCAGAANEKGVKSDVNEDRVCVNAGTNGKLDTTPAAGSDDIIEGDWIVDGPDRICQTAPSGDDRAERKVGDTATLAILKGYDDWSNLDFTFQGKDFFEDGDTSARSIDDESSDYARYQAKLAVELSVTIPPPVGTIPGKQVTLAVAIDNPRPGAASDVSVSVLLPVGLTSVSCTATKGGTCGGSAGNPVVAFAALGGGETATITIVALIDCAVPDGSSLSVTAQIAHSLPDPDPSDDIVTVQLPVSTRPLLDRMMGFEDFTLWHSDQTQLSRSTRTPTQGCYAMDVPGRGYRVLINTTPFATPIAGMTNRLALDLFIPSGQPNPWYLGAIQLYASCPSGNLNNAYVGQVELTGKPIGAYSTIYFTIPDWIGSILRAPHSDCSLAISVNMNVAATAPTLDNLRFVP